MALRIGDTELQVIDAHSHLGRRKTPLGHGVASFLGGDLVRNLDAAGVDRAVSFPLGAPYTDYSEANQVVAAETAKHPDRVIGFCRINPNFGPDATARSLDHCLGVLRLQGIKLHPEIEFFDPNEAELMEPVYEAARRYRVPIIFHTGMSSKASPGVIAELAARYRDVPVILGHMGVSEYVKLAVAVARQHENIFLETSVVGWMPLLLEAFRGVGSTKILFGSDHPYNPLPMEIDKIAKHVAGAAKLDREDLEKVLARNLLGIVKQDR
ncbi:MAG TPA: amidohydrolase family protein [candidate division Zixibacteria bacterium]|nr:amidohydrolase family protein [candidate division Zixibacteria bacterium]